MFFVLKSKYDRDVKKLESDNSDLKAKLDTEKNHNVGLSQKVESLEREVDDLKDVTSNFRKFYESVTQLPVIVKQKDKVVNVKSGQRLTEVDFSYSDRVDSVKKMLVRRLADSLYNLVKFDIESDPSGEPVITALLSVIDQGG